MERESSARTDNLLTDLQEEIIAGRLYNDGCRCKNLRFLTVPNRPGKYTSRHHKSTCHLARSVSKDRPHPFTILTADIP